MNQTEPIGPQHENSTEPDVSATERVTMPQSAPLPPRSATSPQVGPEGAQSGAAQEVSHAPRVGTALWGLVLTLMGITIIAMGLKFTVNITWIVAAGLALIGLVFLAFSLRSPHRQ